jgi:hypothetical protein
LRFDRCGLLVLLLPLLGACGGRSREERAPADSTIVGQGGSATNDPDASPPAPVMDPGAGGSEVGGEPMPPLVRGCPGARSLGSGLERCADGVVHRASAVQCESRLPEENAFLGDQVETYLQRGGDPANVECAQNADCTERAHGFCRADYGGPPFTQCFYGCVSDDDCGTRQACLCGESIGTCTSVRCRSDATCAPGFACTSWQDADCNGYELSCETAEDECRTSADCAAELVCALSAGRRVCTQRGEGCPIELD